MAAGGYETRQLGIATNKCTNKDADVNPQVVEMEAVDGNERTSGVAGDYQQSYAVPETDEVSAQNNESEIKNELNCEEFKRKFKESCLLQIRATPYKSRIVQMKGYKINKENRKWISSMSLAIILILIGIIGGTLNAIDIETETICEASSDKVNEYLEEYKNITDYTQLKPIGHKAKNITHDLFYDAVDKYSYKYSEYPIIKSISKQYLFSKLMKNNTNLTKHCYTGSNNCILPKYNISYQCVDDTPSNCTYDSGEVTSTGIKFPQPHQTSESEILARTECTKTVTVCDVWVYTHAFLCREEQVDCSIDIDLSDGLFFTGETWDTSLHSNFSRIEYEQISDATNEILWEIYERANFLSSIYCLYMALMIFIGGPYVITSTRLTTRIRIQLNKLTKIWFIAVLLIIWYLSEILQLLWGMFIIDTNISLLLQFALVDPCFADSTFITELFKGSAEICGDLMYSQRLYEASRNNLMYYDSIEQTYQYYYWAHDEYIDLNPNDDIRYEYNKASDRMFYQSNDILRNDYDLEYDYNAVHCNVSTVLQHVGPTDSSVSLTAILLFSSAIAALLFQPVLANWIKTIFVLWDPLSPYWGRVEIPYQHEHHIQELDNDFNTKYEATDGLNEFEAGVLNELQDDQRNEKIQQLQDKQDEELENIMTFVKKWERTKHVCPLCCWTVLLVLILISLFGAAVS